ncbi:MAG: hypothetical protein QME78_14035 [Thermodesulfobacteriota bacterium]|nr:hypothetical protein [Thermodesulfobacteriota bacterium]
MKTMRTRRKGWWGKLILAMVGALMLSGTSAFGQPPQGWTSGIAHEVVPEAKITEVDWAMGETAEGGTMMICKVGIRNVSEKPVRFKLTIYLFEGEAVAGLYPLAPRRGKPLALEPKEEMVLKWPTFTKEMPKGYALVVKEFVE